MKRIMAIFLTLVMVFSCSYTALAYTDIKATVKIVDNSGIRDVTSKLDEMYYADDYNLMVPVITLLNESGFLVKNEYTTSLTLQRTSDKKIICITTSEVYRMNSYTIGWDNGSKSSTGYLKYDTSYVNGKLMYSVKDFMDAIDHNIYFDIDTLTYYIVLDDNFISDGITSLPIVESDKALLKSKYPNITNIFSKINEINRNNLAPIPNLENACFQIVQDGKVKDISSKVSASFGDGRTLVTARPIFEAVGAETAWTENPKMLGANLKSDNRIMGILYDGTNMLITIINNQPYIEYTKVSPKLIDGTPMVHYKDISDLLGYKVFYNPQTNTYSYIDAESFALECGTENKDKITSVNNNNSKNYYDTKDKEKLKKQLEREREEREREKEREERQKRLAELEAEIEQLQREREARERQREQQEKVAQDRANSQKTVQVLTKDGWVWMSKAEADAKKSSEKKVKILREGEGWIWVTEEEARQYQSEKNKTSNSTSSSAPATTGTYVIGSGWQTAEDLNKRTAAEKTGEVNTGTPRKVLRDGVGWVYEYD
ncbi:copper amine oxidase N-terminal domain-containing protein [Anaerotignum sp.]